jgi:hypothetical protein
VSALDWSFIKSLPSPIKLADLGLEAVPVAVRNKGDYLYQLGQHEFIYTLPPKWDPYVSHFYWAPTVGAAMRAVLNDPSDDQGELDRPPEELLLDGWRWEYGDILRACETGNHGQFKASLWGTSPAVKPNGRRIHVGDTLSYCFRSRDMEDLQEKAYVVHLDLNRTRWKLCG